MAVIIGSARHDENGKLCGGKAGDQTGREVCTQNFYVHSKGWYIMRAKDAAVAEAIAIGMRTACSNNNIGYDQNERLGIVRNGVNSTVKTEADCGTTVRACCIHAGFDPGNFTTANEVAALKNTGKFMERLTYTSGMILYTGDILVTKTKGHTVIVTAGAYRNQLPKPSANASKSDIIRVGQAHAKNFCGAQIATDGVRGPRTIEASVMVLQTAMNLDYNAGLVVDGDFGPKSNAALGKHYVKFGEQQYMVTAMEILLMLKGYDPNGVECPGKFGNGALKALKEFCGKEICTAEIFKILIQ